MNNKRDISFWLLILLGILLAIMLLAGQTLALFNYDLAVELGLQETEAEVGKVGIAFAKGFAFGDTVFYLPILIIGIIGLLKDKNWGRYLMYGALAVTVYWPLVHLFAIFKEQKYMTLDPDKYIVYPILFSFLIIYALWGMWYLYKR